MSNTITISGTLLDQKMNGRPIGPTFIEFRSGDYRFPTETENDGSFSIELPQTGNWTLAPDSAPEGNTVYAFAPISLDIQEGTLGQIYLDGDNTANTQTLENYVRNVFLACSNIFESQMAAAHKKRGDNLSEDHVKIEAKEVFDIVNSALKHVVDGVVLPEREPIEEGGAVDTNMPCSTCKTKYANDPVMLQQCLCCPTPCY